MPENTLCNTPLLDDLVAHQLLDLIGKCRAQSLFGKFKIEAENLSLKMSQARTHAELQQLRPEIHNFAGSSATFGFTRMYEMVAALEISLTDQALGHAAQIDFDLDPILTETFARYTEFLDEK